MIPYSRQSIDKKDIEAVVKVLRSDFVTQGPVVPEFERALAGFCGAKYAVATTSGTSALHLAYMAAGLGEGDEVITTPNTFVATANMLMVLRAKPVFCDIREDNFNIDEKKIEKFVTKKTKAIVPVHFAGHPCEMGTISKIARKRGLLVIEDACHALGAVYKKSKIGSCRYSDMAVFSFHPVKSITTGEGGVVLTNSKEHYDRLVHLRNHGVEKDDKGKNVMTVLGFNYRMTDIQAALGLSQLEKLGAFIKARNRVAEWYKEELKDAPVILPNYPKNDYSSWHIYVIRVRNPINRDELVFFMKKKGIGVNFHYPALYAHPYYRRNGYKNIHLDNEERYQDSCITLPCYPGLKKSEVKFITDTIKKYAEYV